MSTGDGISGAALRQVVGMLDKHAISNQMRYSGIATTLQDRYTCSS
jgi:hypothetical protein